MDEPTIESNRLIDCAAHTADWKRWGPYLAERAWGTVREDYSADGSAWDYLPHDSARSHAYRWNEDGLLGICDRNQILCFALALWNGQDPIIKERMFGLSGPEGNHGEDVKEVYYYLDSTPTHCYMKALYKYPQTAFPYDDLVAENHRRDKSMPEYELMDTGVFSANRYFDVMVEYAKSSPEDILILITVSNRSGETASLDLLPTLWFRNTWDWNTGIARPKITEVVEIDGASTNLDGCRVLGAAHENLGSRWLICESNLSQPNRSDPHFLFTENETNNVRLGGPGRSNETRFVKDGINDFIVHGDTGAVSEAGNGTKAAAQYKLTVAPGTSATVRLRLVAAPPITPPFGADFDTVFAARKQEADEFYATVIPQNLSDDAKNVQRQALAGMLWSKQFYNYTVRTWLNGDAGQPPPPQQRREGRNCDWRHLYNTEVLSMPDTWEYPWYAAWDLAFHCIPLALVDAEFAKRQLISLCREWYMHPNGQLPAYEWAFGDVNPPVHAWAAFRVYRIEGRVTGKLDRDFLERVFQKLLLNFTWWVNRKDPEGRNVFQGGFLGLDNIGVFDRSATLPDGETLEQSDGTAWMGFYCLSMFAISLELSKENQVYEDLATKFFEHFMYIAGALNNIAGEGVSLWNDADEFFYDVLRMPDGSAIQLKVRSMVGLLPLLAVETIEQSDLDRLPKFNSRLEWFLNNRPDLASLVSSWTVPGIGQRRLVALVRGHRMKALLKRALDPQEFLSDHGIRSVSKYHDANPYTLHIDGQTRSIDYEPAESESGLFGGNSNWRGPVWFPLNYLLIESLQKFHYYYGDDFLVEHPVGSGNKMTLDAIASDLSRRLTRLFLQDETGRRPVFGTSAMHRDDPHWRDYVQFFEYFHGDTGAGLGASHQTGWTGLVAKLIQQSGE